MEVHTKDGVEVWNTLYGVDTYLMKLEDKLTGDYDDMPFVTKNVAPLTNVLNKLRANSSTSLASTLPKQPVIRKVDTKAHTFISSEDLKSSDRSKVNASYQKLKPYSSSLSGNVINPNVYFRLNDSNNRFKLQQTENGAELSLYTSSPNEYTQKVSISDKSFFTTFDSLSKIFQHIQAGSAVFWKNQTLLFPTQRKEAKPSSQCPLPVNPICKNFLEKLR